MSNKKSSKVRLLKDNVQIKKVLPSVPKTPKVPKPQKHQN